MKWLAVRKNDLEPNTYAEYARIVHQRIRPHIGGRKLKALEPHHIAAMLDKLRQPGANRRGKGKTRLSETSLQHTLQALHTALEWAIRQRWIAHNPAADVVRPKREDHEMKVWKGDQLAAFLKHVEGDRLFPLLRLAATTGARRSELLALRWTDIDLKAAVVSITKKRIKVGYEMIDRPVTKTAAGKRRVDIDPQTVRALKRWATVQKAERLAAGEAWSGSEGAWFVFTDELGAPLHADHVDGRFQGLVTAAKVPSIRFHDLRHTHATLMLNAARPVHEVARRLGHSPQVLMSIYAHVLDQQGAEGAAAFAAVIDGRERR